MAKKKLKKILNTVEKIPGVNKIPIVGRVLSVLTAIGKVVDQVTSKKDKIKKLEEKHKKDMETVHKIEMITKDSPTTKEEKIQKDERLKEYFDELLRGEQ